MSGLGSAPHIILREALSQAGMNPDRDVITLAVGGSGDRFAALVAGTVDATPLDVAYVEKAEKLGLVPVSISAMSSILGSAASAFRWTRFARIRAQIVRVIRA